MASAKPILPQLIVNCKAYPEAFGARALSLARHAAALEAELGVQIALCPQPVDVRACAEAGARVFAQHVDLVAKPESTGWLSAAALREAGAVGTLLNHSERRLEAAQVRSYVEHAEAAGLVTVLCTRDAKESGLLAKTRPRLVAVEPPELIGGDVSVTTADPEVVRRSVLAVAAAAPDVRVLCGAGVKTGKDVARAVELGAHGILVASGVTRAKEPLKALRDLARGFP